MKCFLKTAYESKEATLINFSWLVYVFPGVFLAQAGDISGSSLLLQRQFCFTSCPWQHGLHKMEDQDQTILWITPAPPARAALSLFPWRRNCPLPTMSYNKWLHSNKNTGNNNTCAFHDEMQRWHVSTSMRSSRSQRRDALNFSQITSFPLTFSFPTWSYHSALSMWGFDVKIAPGKAMGKEKYGGRNGEELTDSLGINPWWFWRKPLVSRG